MTKWLCLHDNSTLYVPIVQVIYNSGKNYWLVIWPFLNQAHADRRPACAWLIRIATVCEYVYACVCVFVCVCPPPRLSITSGVMWCDIDPI